MASQSECSSVKPFPSLVNCGKRKQNLESRKETKSCLRSGLKTSAGSPPGHVQEATNGQQRNSQVAAADNRSYNAGVRGFSPQRVPRVFQPIKLAAYDGTPAQEGLCAQRFLKRLEAYLRNTPGLTEGQMALTLYHNLAGDAQTWADAADEAYFAVHDRSLLDHWDVLKERFLQRFGKVDAARSFVMLAHVRQCRDETVAGVALRLQDLFAQAGVCSEQVKIHHLKVALPSTLREQLHVRGATTFDQAVQVAEELDRGRQTVELALELARAGSATVAEDDYSELAAEAPQHCSIRAISAVPHCSSPTAGRATSVAPLRDMCARTVRGCRAGRAVAERQRTIADSLWCSRPAQVLTATAPPDSVDTDMTCRFDRGLRSESALCTGGNRELGELGRAEGAARVANPSFDSAVGNFRAALLACGAARTRARTSSDGAAAGGRTVTGDCADVAAAATAPGSPTLTARSKAPPGAHLRGDDADSRQPEEPTHELAHRSVTSASDYQTIRLGAAPPGPCLVTSSDPELRLEATVPSPTVAERSEPVTRKPLVQEEPPRPCQTKRVVGSRVSWADLAEQDEQSEDDSELQETDAPERLTREQSAFPAPSVRDLCGHREATLARAGPQHTPGSQSPTEVPGPFTQQTAVLARGSAGLRPGSLSDRPVSGAAQLGASDVPRIAAGSPRGSLSPPQPRAGGNDRLPGRYLTPYQKRTACGESVRCPLTAAQTARPCPVGDGLVSIIAGPGADSGNGRIMQVATAESDHTTGQRQRRRGCRGGRQCALSPSRCNGCGGPSTFAVVG